MSSSSEGIRVQRDTTVLVEHHRQPAGDMSRSNLTTLVGSGEPDGRPRRTGRPRTFIGFSSPSNFINGMFRPDTSEPPVVDQSPKKAAKRHSGFVDFIRNTPAPANNTPPPASDSFDQEPEKDTKRRSFWQFFKKSREDRDGRPTPQPDLQPDAAVAGQATGDHRRAGISSPVEQPNLSRWRRQSMPIPSRLPSQSAITAEDGGESSRAHKDKARRRASTMALPNDDRYSMLWYPHTTLALGPDGQAQTGENEPPRSRVADAMVRPHSMLLTPPPELTAHREGHVFPADLVTNDPPSKGRTLRRQLNFHFHPTEGASISAAAPDSNISLNKPSLVRKSSNTSSSSTDAIFFDAATSPLPSPAFPPGYPGSRYSSALDAEATSSCGRESDVSPLTDTSTESSDGTERRESILQSLACPLGSAHEAVLHSLLDELAPAHQSELLAHIHSLKLPRETATSQMMPAWTETDTQSSPPSEASSPQPQQAAPEPMTAYRSFPAPKPHNKASRTLRRMPANSSLRRSTIAGTPWPSPPRSPDSGVAKQHTCDSRSKDEDLHYEPEDLPTLRARVDRLEDVTDGWLSVRAPIAEPMTRGSMLKPAHFYRAMKTSNTYPEWGRGGAYDRRGVRGVSVGEAEMEESERPGVSSMPEMAGRWRGRGKRGEKGRGEVEEELLQRRESLERFDFGFGKGGTPTNGTTQALAPLPERIPTVVKLPPKRVRFAGEVEVFEDDGSDGYQTTWFRLEPIEDSGTRSVLHPDDRILSFREHDERLARSVNAPWMEALAASLRRRQQQAIEDLSGPANGWESMDGIIRELVRGAPLGRDSNYGVGEELETYEMRFARENTLNGIW